MMFAMQCLVAIVVGAVVSCRMYWTILKSRVVSLFTRNSSKTVAETADAEETVVVNVTATDFENNNDNQRKAA